MNVYHDITPWHIRRSSGRRCAEQARFAFADVSLTYSVSGGEGVAAREVVIMDQVSAGEVNLPLG